SWMRPEKLLFLGLVHFLENLPGVPPVELDRVLVLERRLGFGPGLVDPSDLEQSAREDQAVERNRLRPLPEGLLECLLERLVAQRLRRGLGRQVRELLPLVRPALGLVGVPGVVGVAAVRSENREAAEKREANDERAAADLPPPAPLLCL